MKLNCYLTDFFLNFHLQQELSRIIKTGLKNTSQIMQGGTSTSRDGGISEYAELRLKNWRISTEVVYCAV